MRNDNENVCSPQSMGCCDLSFSEDGGNHKKQWLSLLLSKFPKRRPLKIMDVGTGSGFFPIILSQVGHKVTGIDISSETINLARCNAAQESVSPELLVMDGHSTTFPDGSFDAVISRNVVWSLKRPKEAYREWHRLIKPGGRLLVFDADWLVDCRDEEIRNLEIEDRNEFIAQFGPPPKAFDEYIAGLDWRKGLPLAARNRPEWDEKELLSIGFRNITSSYISGEVYGYGELVLTRSMPLFMINATKI